jgi:hypothetical protein
LPALYRARRLLGDRRAAGVELHPLREDRREFDQLFAPEHGASDAVSPHDPEAKYKAKAAIDTFFVRAGDVLAAVFVFAGTKLAFEAGDFARVNIVLALVWIALALAIVRRNQALSLASREIAQAA